MRTFTLPGGLAGPPSACSAADDRLDVFATGPGNTVWRWSMNGSTWAAPAPLPPAGSIPAEGVCAIASGPGRVEVFAAEQGSRSPVWWRGNGAAWTPGPALPSGANLPAEPVAAVCGSPNDIDVFAAGAGNTPWWWHWNGTSWTAATPLPGGGLPAERIAAVRCAPGRLDVFAAGAGNHLWHWGKSGTAAWRVAEDLGGNLPAEGVSAVSWGLNRIDVFAASRAPGNPLWHWWSTGGGFGQESLGGSLAVGSVSAVSHAADRLDIFGLSGDGRLAHWFWDGQRWNGPFFRGDGIPAGDVSAVVRKAHRLDVFVAGAGNTLRQWPGGGLENATTQPWMNWPTNRERNPVAGHLRPDSLEELVNVAGAVQQAGGGARAVGSSWSNSDVAVPPAYVVETDKLAHLLPDVLDTSLASTVTSDLRSRLVHVEAGIKVEALNKLLDDRNLALRTMGGSSGQSLAGVVSTSAHGMDVDRGPIPDMVRAMHLVGPGGVQHWIEPSTPITDRAKLKAAIGIDDANIHYDDEWFSSVLVSMGGMGVIYSLIVETVPQYDLIGNCEALDWSTMKSRLTAPAGGTDDPFVGTRGVQVVIQPYAKADGSRLCYLTRRIEAPKTAPFVGKETIPSSLLPGITLGLMRTLKVTRSEIDNTVWDLTSLIVGCEARRGFGHTIMGDDKLPDARGLTVEVVFDATKTRYLEFIDSALEILRKAFFEEPGGSLGYLGWISLRFQGRSRAHLSPQRFSRSCTVEFAAAWRIPGLEEWPDTPILISRIEAEGRRFGGIQHWGMFDQMNASDVARAFPRLDTWRRVRWDLTNGGTITTFDNDFMRRCALTNPPIHAYVVDNNGDGHAEPAIWRPSTGTWIVQKKTNKKWGQAGDVPVPGDYDGDGSIDYAVWRPSSGMWLSIDSSTGKQRKQQWGEAGDIAVPRDYSGDGKTDFAVWRPSSGTWFVMDSTTKKSRSQQWGEAGDIPVPGDYSGDGKTDFAVWRPKSGTWFVFDSATGAQRSQQWGDPRDIPVPGDYSGDGKTDFAIWRPSTGTWWILDSVTGAQRSQQWGEAGDVPVPGDYSGDGKTDFAIWRPGTGTWWILDSATGAQRSQVWGRLNDIPV